MKNIVKCYKDFFGYFNALKTHCVIQLKAQIHYMRRGKGEAFNGNFGRKDPLLLTAEVIAEFILIWCNPLQETTWLLI